MTTNRRVLLQQRPVGLPRQEDFAFIEAPVPEPATGQIVIRNVFISLDPAIRGWMDDRPSYFPPIALGDPVRATTVGRVAKSAHPDFKEGDWVVGLNAWEDYSLAEAGGFTSVVDPSLVPSPSAYLSILGAVGMTAYFGLLDLGKPKAGETVLVSAAAGAVGSLVGQIAKIQGCRAVGIAGSDDKCAWVTGELGFDAAFNYKGLDVPALAARIAETCPDGVDVYFDNVGGDILDAALININDNARMIECGMISVYNEVDPPPGPRHLWQLIVHTARMEGFLIRDYVPRFPEGIAQMADWLAAGKLTYREDMVEGLDNAVTAFLKLFHGTNVGKLVLKIAEA